MIQMRKVSIFILGLTALLVIASLLLWLVPIASAQGVAATSGLSPEAVKWGFLGAALATGMSSLGAGYAVAAVGSSAIGALAEKPELLGRVLIMVGLAEGIAIYGLIVSILILNAVL